MNTVTQKRDVSNFSRVRMQDWGELHVAQGSEEALNVEADPETLDKIFTEVKDGELILRVGRDWRERLHMGLHTSLTRPRIRYTVGVKNLSSLAVSGFGRVTVAALNTSVLALELSGAGEIDVQSLSTASLSASLSGGGNITVAGKSQQQSVSLSGAGRYDAGWFQSQVAHVAITGAGSARVWVTDDLDVNLAGIGSVEYYGHPVVHKSISGLGSLSHLGDRQPGPSPSQRGL